MSKLKREFNLTKLGYLAIIPSRTAKQYWVHREELYKIQKHKEYKAMLQEFKNKLIHLAEENRDFFIQRIQERIPTEEGITMAISLQSFILTMPELIIQIRRWMKEPGCPSHIKRVSGFLLTYIYHPVDFIPEERLGLFGYLDDAYLTGRIFIQTMNFTNHNERHFIPNMKNLATDIPNWIMATRRILPKETRKIDQMLKELLEGQTHSFDRLMAHQS